MPQPTMNLLAVMISQQVFSWQKIDQICQGKKLKNLAANSFL